MAAFFSACEDDVETTPPSLSINLPRDNQQLTAGDELIIQGRASDESGLGELVVTVFRPASPPVFERSEVFSLSDKSQDFEFRLPVSSRYAETGEYLLQISALDIHGNGTTAEIPLLIDELPWELQRPMWVGEDGSGNATLHYRDTLGQLQTGPMLGNQLADVKVDNRFRQLIAAESTTGNAQVWSLNDLAPLYTIDLPTGVVQENITGVSVDQDQIYLGSSVPPYLSVYLTDGDRSGAWSSLPYPVKAVLAGESQLWLSVEGQVGTPTKVDHYDPGTEQLQATYITDWRTDYLLELDGDRLVVAGNENRAGRLRILEANSLQAGSELDLTDEIIGLAGQGNDSYVLTNLGAYQLNPTNGNLLGPVVAGDYTAIGWEREFRQLYLGKENTVEVYDANGNAIATYTGGYGKISWFIFQYNK